MWETIEKQIDRDKPKGERDGESMHVREMKTAHTHARTHAHTHQISQLYGAKANSTP